MKITDFENRRSFKCIWLNSQFREEVSLFYGMSVYFYCILCIVSLLQTLKTKTTKESSLSGSVC